MRGVGWMAGESLDVRQAKKAGDIISEVKQHHVLMAYSQHSLLYTLAATVG